MRRAAAGGGRRGRAGAAGRGRPGHLLPALRRPGGARRRRLRGRRTGRSRGAARLARAARPGARAARARGVLRLTHPAHRAVPVPARPGRRPPRQGPAPGPEGLQPGERELAGAADAPLVASAVAATFAGVLADWLHGLLDATAADIADQVWQLLVALHASR